MTFAEMDQRTLDDIRRVVRECVRELISGDVVAEPRESSMPDGPTVESVRIQTDADLQAFTARLCALLEDPAQRDAITSGRRRFALGPSAVPDSQPERAAPSSTASPSASSSGRSQRAGTEVAYLPDGVLTERGVVQLAKTAARVVLGATVRVTPLAHDKARDLGLGIEREA